MMAIDNVRIFSSQWRQATVFDGSLANAARRFAFRFARKIEETDVKSQVANALARSEGGSANFSLLWRNFMSRGADRYKG
jgi:hypothetical protein